MRTVGILGLACLVAAHVTALADELRVTVESITTPVHPGGVVTLVVRTQPGAVCQGNRQGHFGNGYTVALASQSVGPGGLVRWDWSVLSGSHPIGIRGVHVICAALDRSGALNTSFDVR